MAQKQVASEIPAQPGGKKTKNTHESELLLDSPGSGSFRKYHSKAAQHTARVTTRRWSMACANEPLTDDINCHEHPDRTRIPGFPLESL